MAVNQGIVVGTVGIVAVGVIGAAIKNEPVTPLIIAGYLVGVTASLIDLLPGAGVIAGGIVMAAFFGILLSSVGWLQIFSAATATRSSAESSGTNAATAANSAKNRQ